MSAIAHHPENAPAPLDALEALALRVLEWPRLQSALEKRCLSVYGQRTWQQAPFLQNPESAATHLQEVALLHQLLARYGWPRWDKALPLIDTIINRAAKGAILSLPEACELSQALQGMRNVIGYIGNQLPGCVADKAELNDKFGWLWSTLLPGELMEQLMAWLDADAEAFRESASPELQALRQRHRGQKRRQEQEAQAYLQQAEVLACLQNASYVVRDGRLALPVKASHKNQIKGTLLGSSASGGTVFIEPQGLQASYQRLLETEAEIKREERRLLQELSKQVEAHAEALANYANAFTELDRRLAAAQLSKDLDAVVPALQPHGAAFHLHQARHPLLVLEPPPGGVVANTITLGQNDIRTLVITGPNTGGKTVVLKTVGLLAFMLRAGLPLPVKEGSRCSWLAPIFADIGDAQDLTQNLSTFSGHLLRLNEVLKQPEGTWRQGLILIDEIVAGTDPVEGSALAKALLKRFYEAGALTLVSTHLGVLKLEAHDHPGYQNASAVFDLETLAPTYKLYLGIPGSSNALAIAQRLGLPEGLIDAARQTLAQGDKQAGSLLSELETSRHQAEEDREVASRLRLELEAERKALAAEKEALRQGKQRELEQFRSGLRRRLMGVDKQLKAIRKQVRQAEGQVEAAATTRLAGSRLRHVESELEGEFEQLEASLAEEAALAAEQQNQTFSVGDTVYSEQLGQRATVSEVRKNGQRYTISAGLVKVTVEASDLQAVDAVSTEAALARKKSEHKRLQQRLRSMATSQQTNRRQSLSGKVFKPELDVRGQRAEEALEATEVFIDEALQHGLEVVRIIHGLGTGALKKAIRQWLGRQPFVERFYPEQAIHGGDGNTVIELKG